MHNHDALDYYTRHSRMTCPGRFASRIESLPEEVPTLVRIIQGLALYDVVADRFYGFNVPPARTSEIHIRRVEGRLERLLELDDRSLEFARPPERRVLGRCHQFVLLLVTMLRSQGVPARARCGFGAYFNRPKFEDHWVCEYWNVQERRWILVDPQFDEAWRKRLGIRHDVLDVPRTQFLIAADAWQLCRQGTFDPELFGISFAELYGLWFIAGSLVRDMAALNRMEMLPWDIWGVQPRRGQMLGTEQLSLFDELAHLTRDPDAMLVELQQRYEADDRVRVPSTVFNALLKREEPV
jgi:hypothetical protein